MIYDERESYWGRDGGGVGVAGFDNDDSDGSGSGDGHYDGHGIGGGYGNDNCFGGDFVHGRGFVEDSIAISLFTNNVKRIKSDCKVQKSRVLSTVLLLLSRFGSNAN